MDTLQIQISELTDKIDRLHQIIEQISHQVKELSLHQQQQQERDYHSLSNFEPTSSHFADLEERQEYHLTHKDILIDDNSSTSSTASNSEQNLAPEIQIRRLTAQLTAAYNRIAALEEQLLTYRIHP